jgi:hypothetical protein
MATQDTFNQIQALLEEFNTNHEKNAGGNKAAGTRARKAASEVKKLLTSYRKESIEQNK